LIGSILVEIKLTNNSEITNKSKRDQYKKKFIQYIRGTKSNYGLFMIFQIDEENKIGKYLPELEKLYKSESEIFVTGINCIGS
jgi:hypothetical protein